MIKVLKKINDDQDPTNFKMTTTFHVVSTKVISNTKDEVAETFYCSKFINWWKMEILWDYNEKMKGNKKIKIRIID